MGSNGGGASKSKWYTSKVAIGAFCAVFGLAVGSAGSEKPEDSQAYEKLETSYEHAKSELASFKQQEDTATTQVETRSAQLDEQEAELKALKKDLDKREAKLKAAEDKAKQPKTEPKAQTRQASPKPAQLVGGCTRTSKGTCIQGGQFCPEAKYGQTGHDANGRSYRCTGSKSRPHWM